MPSWISFSMSTLQLKQRVQVRGYKGWIKLGSVVHMCIAIQTSEIVRDGIIPKHLILIVWPVCADWTSNLRMGSCDNDECVQNQTSHEKLFSSLTTPGNSVSIAMYGYSSSISRIMESSSSRFVPHTSRVRRFSFVSGGRLIGAREGSPRAQ